MHFAAQPVTQVLAHLHLKVGHPLKHGAKIERRSATGGPLASNLPLRCGEEAQNRFDAALSSYGSSAKTIKVFPALSTECAVNSQLALLEPTWFSLGSSSNVNVVSAGVAELLCPPYDYDSAIRIQGQDRLGSPSYSRSGNTTSLT